MIASGLNQNLWWHSWYLRALALQEIEISDLEGGIEEAEQIATELSVCGLQCSLLRTEWIFRMLDEVPVKWIVLLTKTFPRDIRASLTLATEEYYITVLSFVESGNILEIQEVSYSRQ